MELLNQVWSLVVGVLTIAASVGASVHAVVYKRDDRAAVGWVGLIWLVPLVGAILYVLLGINRIQRRAALLRSDSPTYHTSELEALRLAAAEDPGSPEAVRSMGSLPALMDRVTRRPLTLGNQVEYLTNGDEAYPAMLREIERAEQSVALSTYIFDNDRAGAMFREALVSARRRGVEVRVLIDAVGARYSWPSMVRVLRNDGIRVARFIPTLLPWRMPYMNLRNHRKLLLVDGKVGFTGGMNIRSGHLVAGKHHRRLVQDVHFRLEGPVVSHIAETFAEDWTFCTGERLDESWFPKLGEVGPVAARGVVDGPDEDFERLKWTFHGAIGCAERSVRIVTPYFVPDQALIQSLNVAALRGVAVEAILPEVNNQALVRWASTARLWQLLQQGCRVFFSPPPFDHSKLMLVDETWVLLGSANWDARSIRLNFEFNVECYDRDLAERLDRWFQGKKEAAREVDLEDLNRRPLPLRVRDGAARLLSPYL